MHLKRNAKSSTLSSKYFEKHIVESQMDFDKSMWGNEKTEDCIG